MLVWCDVNLGVRVASSAVLYQTKQDKTHSDTWKCMVSSLAAVCSPATLAAMV